MECKPERLFLAVAVVVLAVAAVAGEDTKAAQMEASTVQPRQDKSDFIADALLRAGMPAGDVGLSSVVARNYKKMAQTILPLLVGFKATGMLVMAMAVTKFVLLKALFLSTTALLIAALLALKKFLSSGQPHDVPAAYTYSHHDLSHMPYLSTGHTGAEQYMEASHMQMPQVTYIGGSYGLQSIPYSAATGAGVAAAGAGLGAADDVQGLYSTNANTVAALSAAQLQQLQQLQQQALLAQQLGSASGANGTQQAGQLLQLSRRRLNVPPGATVSSPYPYRPTRTETRPA
ncbi:uncharacterized protein LOC117647160 [Thrips palmi]|uniref:Uncharacterized protein LOC117647160 n=1 Tax=Thrips palmi TaxID=161013 RepID=A0A6P8Z4C9_THRPL|nr:uncharacterized protein LOC117647160 [Thrips palmi]